MASASLATPRVERVASRLMFIESDERPGLYYRTTPHTCSCPDWQHRGGSACEHRCKHMQFAFPIRCSQCGTNQVPAAGELCGWCAEDLNEQAIAGGRGIR